MTTFCEITLDSLLRKQRVLLGNTKQTLVDDIYTCKQISSLIKPMVRMRDTIKETLVNEWIYTHCIRTVSYTHLDVYKRQ